MADLARSEAFIEANGMKEGDGEQEMRRRLFERFMASCGPSQRPYLYEAEKVPCLLYTMRVSVKNARASWSHRSSRRFFSERRGSFPIPLCRAAGPDGQVEPVVDRSGEPDRPGIVSGVYEDSYDLLELSREKGVIHKEGSPAPWKEVAVIRGTPGGRGISVTSHVKYLVVQLHDILFLLPGPSATVDLRFSERWFRLPTRWTEERLYAEDGFHIVDIGFSVENLVRKLYSMRTQEDVEIEMRRFETEEEREMRLQEEEATRQQAEEERRKIRERKEEERKMEEEEHAPRVWDAALWLVNPATARRYSKFKLSMDRHGIVSCDCVEQQDLGDMLWRVDNGEYGLLPISKTAPESGALETLGSVEGYWDIETLGFGHRAGYFMDLSGRTLSSVLMVSRSAAKVLTITILVHKLDILMDDGMVMSGHDGVSVDVHCDDISSSSELFKTNWVYHILCKNTHVEGRTSFSALLVQLKKKLKVHLTEQEWELYSLTAVDTGEDDEDLLEQLRKGQNWVPAKPKHDLEEVELHDCSILFPVPCEY